MKREQWLPIPGYEGLYDVSDMGRVRSYPRNGTQHKTPIILKRRLCKTKGYVITTLTKNNKAKIYSTHILVMLAFVGTVPHGMECCHNDGVRSNCLLSNLRYDTRKNNHKDKLAHGTHQAGEKNGSAKLSYMDVKAIRRRASKGELLYKIAADYPVTKEMIGRIVSGKNWAKAS